MVNRQPGHHMCWCRPTQFVSKKNAYRLHCSSSNSMSIWSHDRRLLAVGVPQHPDVTSTPALSCTAHNTQATQSIKKQRLSAAGKPVAEAEHHDVHHTRKGAGGKASNTTCGSCYGAETAALSCCNTCEDVRDVWWRSSACGIRAGPHNICCCRPAPWLSIPCCSSTCRGCP